MEERVGGTFHRADRPGTLSWVSQGRSAAFRLGAGSFGQQTRRYHGPPRGWKSNGTIASVHAYERCFRIYANAGRDPSQADGSAAMNFASFTVMVTGSQQSGQVEVTTGRSGLDLL